jgi:hypothetical protein
MYEYVGGFFIFVTWICGWGNKKVGLYFWSDPVKIPIVTNFAVAVINL